MFFGFPCSLCPDSRVAMIAAEVIARFLRVNSPRMHSATPMLGVVGVVASDFDNGSVTVDVGFSELGGVE